jgi:hypothetical protein
MVTLFEKSRIEEFAARHRLAGLTPPSLDALASGRAGYTLDKARRLVGFRERIARELLNHRIIADNRYTAWFSRGEQSLEQLRVFVVQFSVFSNQFLIAQLNKTINADSLEGMRASKEILANEIGVVFNSGRRPTASRAVEPELVSTEGSVEGGTFHFRAAHFEWLLHLAEKLGLAFGDLGRRRHGTPSTLFFCDELIRLYGGEDYLTSQAASYAVENWAAAGFWKQLVQGLARYNARTDANLPLAFFAWHDRLEAQHARHTQEELEELYFARDLDESAFIRDGNAMLEGVAAFWDGLDTERQSLARAA